MTSRNASLEILDSDMRNKAVYTIEFSENPRDYFTPTEKELLRPIAETLAMLDGNAFFGNHLDEHGKEWYEQYLPEAWELFVANGALDGWSSGMGHIAEWRLRDENPMLQSLWEQYQTALRLTMEGKDG